MRNLTAYEIDQINDTAVVQKPLWSVSVDTDFVTFNQTHWNIDLPSRKITHKFVEGIYFSEDGVVTKIKYNDNGDLRTERSGLF